MRNKKNKFFYYIKKIFAPFELIRKITLNLLFWAFFLLLIISPFIGENIKLTGSQNTLIIEIHGTVVEELSGTTLSRTIGDYNGIDMSETLLWDILDSIETAASDDKINSILLDFRYMGGAGLAALTEIRSALDNFKETGKKIIAFSDAYDQSSYFVASIADEIYVDPMGDFLITGFSVYNRYYGEGLERLGIDVNYFHAGKYKSYGEVYTRSSMSDEAREENLHWSGDLWEYYVETVSESRGMSPGQFSMFIDNYVDLLEESGGSTVRTALDVSLIDGVKDREELRSLMIDISGFSFDFDTFNQIYFEDYLQLKGQTASAMEDKVAIITASGTIYNGYEDPGNIGGDSLSELIDAVQYDSFCKALVLRVDSGGGSAFASEIVRRKLEKLRESGVPVVISMGSVAASGGYWISTASDEIWALPTTITGSIGVFSLIATFEDPLSEYLGITVDGVGTTWMAGSMRSDRDLDPRVGKIYQSSVDHIYREFLNVVSMSSGKSIEEVHAVAQGRVWSGTQARDNGLVDQLGGLDKAVEAAAGLAGLDPDSYRKEFVRRELPMSDRLINTILGSSVSSELFSNFSLFELISQQTALKKLKALEELNDPAGVYALSSLMFK
ncbi:MAG: signal peptide peptidase SppA [Spirochaetaceae bacterium]|nr:signal peptide peptidase SppA [Spirochaetaceae bacterium]